MRMDIGLSLALNLDVFSFRSAVCSLHPIIIAQFTGNISSSCTRKYDHHRIFMSADCNLKMEFYFVYAHVL